LSHKLDNHTPFQWIETIGVPIDLMLSIFYLCAKREINWDQFVAEARKAKWKPKTIIDKVTYGVRDAMHFKPMTHPNSDATKLLEVPDIVEKVVNDILERLREQQNSSNN
jgi:hypothetical protein